MNTLDPTDLQKTTSVSPLRAALASCPWTGEPPRSQAEAMSRTFTVEELLFLWYHAVDLGMPWFDILERFNAQFPQGHRPLLFGLQCRFHRFMYDAGCPDLMIQISPVAVKEQWGMVVKTGIWLPWMETPSDKARNEEAPSSISA